MREEEIVDEIRDKVRQKLLASDNSRVFIAQSVTLLKDKVSQASGQMKSISTGKDDIITITIISIKHQASQVFNHIIK